MSFNRHFHEARNSSREHFREHGVATEEEDLPLKSTANSRIHRTQHIYSVTSFWRLCCDMLPIILNLFTHSEL